MRIRSVLKHTAQALVEGSLIALLVVGLMAGSVFAGKPTGGGGTGGGGHTKPGGGGSTGGSISVVLVSDVNHDGAPNYGDVITYDVTKAGVAYPYITTTCVQNGVNVLTAFAGYYPEYMWQGARTFTLSSDVWGPGSATCTAVLSNTTVQLVFNVGA
jgi:hypothetical protein